MNIKNNNDLFVIAEANIANEIDTIIVRVVGATGSTPRDKNAIMLIETDDTHDTIGGGQLEWIVIQKARSVLGNSFEPFKETILLGPEINQCCGGRMELEYSVLSKISIKEAFDTISKSEPDLPNVFIFGAGHTGTELAIGFSRLPVKIICIDTRKDALTKLENICKTICTPLPEEIIRNAPINSGFIILTHDHNLDFMLTAEALTRKDAAYVGMIGSATKKAVFKNWIAKNDYDISIFSNLICPIGKSVIKNKRPTIIAALTIAEVLKRLLK